jgi:ribosomal protein S18 acetylase RimI-like enzyme
VLRIERAGIADMAGVYRVCRMTGDVGEDATPLYPDPDLCGHVWAGAYLARDGGTRLVAVDDEGVAGYIISTDDTLAFDAWAEAHWWPPLRERYPRMGVDTPSARLIRRIHEPEERTASIVARYPAHFHIDLLARTRGTGMGRRLVERVLGELRGRGIAGVHMGVDARNTNALSFYEHLGFRTLEQGGGGVIMGMPLDRG